MVLKLFLHEVSPGVRAVLMTAAALGIEIDEKIPVDLLNGEHMREEYGKRNPARTVPSLEDDGFIVNDSHVILAYLVSKFGKNDDLYPKDVKKRSKVDFILHYDNGILFPVLYSSAMKIYKFVSKTPSAEDITGAEKAYEILEKLLEGHTYTAGDYLSIGDISVITSMSSLQYLIPIDKEKYPNVLAWIERMKKLPYYQINQNGLDKHTALWEEFRRKFP